MITRLFGSATNWYSQSNFDIGSYVYLCLCIRFLLAVIKSVIVREGLSRGCENINATVSDFYG